MERLYFYIRPIILALPFILHVNDSRAQKIIRSSINTFGASYSNGTVALQQTAGQTADYATLHNTSGSLHQGFIQGASKQAALHNESISFQLVPNPGNGLFTIYFDKKTPANLTMRIFNLSGELISSRQIGQHALQQSFDLTSCSAGVYFIQLDGEESKPVTKKLILTR